MQVVGGETVGSMQPGAARRSNRAISALTCLLGRLGCCWRGGSACQHIHKARHFRLGQVLFGPLPRQLVQHCPRHVGRVSHFSPPWGLPIWLAKSWTSSQLASGCGSHRRCQGVESRAVRGERRDARQSQPTAECHATISVPCAVVQPCAWSITKNTLWPLVASFIAEW